MTQQLLPESPEKTKQDVERHEPRSDSVPSFQGGFHPLHQLQRTLGNRNVAKLIQAKRLTPEGKITGFQRKLTVGAADDQYEQEADRVARQVMNTPDAVVTASGERSHSSAGAQNQILQTKPLAASITPVVQRQRGKENEVEEDKDGEEEKDESLQAKFFSESVALPLQRQKATKEGAAEPIQAKSTGSMAGSFEAGADVETQVSLSKGRGSPLPEPVRAYMEPRFGVDFSHVHVHTGSDAEQMNQAVGAQAFTHGSDIYFGAGHGPSNLELTAHELTHVVQQTGGALVKTKRLDEASSTNTKLHTKRTCATCGAGKEEEKGADSIFHAPASNVLQAQPVRGPKKEPDWEPEVEADTRSAHVEVGKTVSLKFHVLNERTAPKGTTFDWRGIRLNESEAITMVGFSDRIGAHAILVVKGRAAGISEVGATVYFKMPGAQEDYEYTPSCARRSWVRDRSCSVGTRSDREAPCGR